MPFRINDLQGFPEVLPAKGTLKSAAVRSPWPTDGAVSSRQHARPAASGPTPALPFLLICKALVDLTGHRTAEPTGCKANRPDFPHTADGLQVAACTTPGYRIGAVQHESQGFEKRTTPSLSPTSRQTRPRTLEHARPSGRVAKGRRTPSGNTAPTRARLDIRDDQTQVRVAPTAGGPRTRARTSSSPAETASGAGSRRVPRPYPACAPPQEVEALTILHATRVFSAPARAGPALGRPALVPLRPPPSCRHDTKSQRNAPTYPGAPTGPARSSTCRKMFDSSGEIPPCGAPGSVTCPASNTPRREPQPQQP